MLEIAECCSKRFEGQHLGAEVEVLWESCRDGIWQGTTDNYIRVLKQSTEPLANQLRRERLLEASARGVFCQPADQIQATLATQVPKHSPNQETTPSP